MTNLEIDIAIANLMVGWKPSKHDTFWDDQEKRPRMIWKGVAHQARIKLDIEDNINDKFIFSPSQNTRDAWEALKQLKKDKGWYVLVENKGEEWKCTIKDEEGNESYGKNVLDTIAICQAILEACN